MLEFREKSQPKEEIEHQGIYVSKYVNVILKSMNEYF